MNAVEIEEAISALAEQPFDAAEFPFAFLQAFGNKETTLKRLRKVTRVRLPGKTAESFLTAALPIPTAPRRGLGAAPERSPCRVVPTQIDPTRRCRL